MLSLWDLWQYLCLWWERLDHILVNPTCLLVVFILTYHLESVRNGCVIELFVTVFVLSLCVPWVLLTNCLESLNKSLEHSCRVLFFYKMTKFWYGFKISRRKQMNFRGKVFNEYNKLGGGGVTQKFQQTIIHTFKVFSQTVRTKLFWHFLQTSPTSSVGRASDFRSQGCGLESLCGQAFFILYFVAFDALLTGRLV